jgi:hypothetical protein
MPTETTLQIPNTPSAIITTDDLANATSVLSTLNQHLDAITTEKEKVTKPLNEALKAERARFKPTEERLTQAIVSIKAMMSQYLQNEQKKKDDALAALASGTADLAQAVTLAGQETTSANSSTGNGKVSFITVRKFRITDITKVPHAYLLPNEPLIRQAMKDNTPIEGVTYYEDKQIRNTR